MASGIAVAFIDGAGLPTGPVVADLVTAQLFDQVRFSRQPEYVFHRPLIRAVAYESQLKSDRAELHVVAVSQPYAVYLTTGKGD
jgi:hypothetical protein